MHAFPYQMHMGARVLIKHMECQIRYVIIQPLEMELQINAKARECSWSIYPCMTSWLITFQPCSTRRELMNRVHYQSCHFRLPRLLQRGFGGDIPRYSKTWHHYQVAKFHNYLFLNPPPKKYVSPIIFLSIRAWTQFGHKPVKMRPLLLLIVTLTSICINLNEVQSNLTCDDFDMEKDKECLNNAKVKELQGEFQARALENDKDGVEETKCKITKAVYGCYMDIADKYKEVPNCRSRLDTIKEMNKAREMGCGAVAQVALFWPILILVCSTLFFNLWSSPERKNCECCIYFSILFSKKIFMYICIQNSKNILTYRFYLIVLFHRLD